MSETETRAETDEQRSDPVLEVENATVSYEMSRGRARVLNDVSLTVERGETLGIVGESGSGKTLFGSTILDAVEDPGQLSGDIIYHPEEGESVNIPQLEAGDLRRVRWEEISIVFQGAMSAFNPTQPLRVHFEETLDAHNEDEEEGMERARQILRDLNLEPEKIMDSYQHTLSGGQRQRALLALSLVLEPEVLVLDEPTAALDLLMQRTILRLLERVKEDYDLTMLFITHDLPIVAGIADRLAVMYAFEFVEIGETREVMRDGAHPYTRMLLNSTPNFSMSVDQINPVEGSSPDPVNIPVGCPYHPRCPVSDDRCEEEKPALVELEEGHRAACFYTDRAKDELPVSFGGDEE
ncbi:MAG: ABC transporter ATP-binding protein [Halobacteriaceae archaeon]